MNDVIWCAVAVFLSLDAMLVLSLAEWWLQREAR